MKRTLLQGDFWLKISSVVMAIALWAIVMSDYMQETSRSFDVPLTVKPHPFYEVYEGPQDREMRIEVRAVGRNLVISRLKLDEIKAEIDYGKVNEPGKSVALDVKVTGPGRAQYYAIPKTVSVTLVENRDAMIPVTVVPQSDIITYNTREYRFTARSVIPKAQISGRSDYLARVKQAHLELRLQDLVPTDTHLTRKLSLLDANGLPVEKLVAPSIEVELSWELLPPGKSVRIQPLMSGTLPSGFEITGFDAVPASVVMRATTLNGKLPETDLVETEPINLANHNKSFTTTVKLVPPQGTTLSAETSNVTVHIGERMLEKSFSAIPITVTGKGSDELSLAVSDVQVRLQGPYSIINAIEARQIAAYVQADGLSAGKHMLPVKINRPPGPIEEFIDPAMVEVTIIGR